MNLAQKRRCPVSTPDVGGMNLRRQQRGFIVRDDRTLVAANLPASVIALRPAALRSLHYLAVNHACRRLLVALDAGLLPAAQAVKFAMAGRPRVARLRTVQEVDPGPAERVHDILAQSPFRTTEKNVFRHPGSASWSAVPWSRQE